MPRPRRSRSSQACMRSSVWRARMSRQDLCSIWRRTLRASPRARRSWSTAVSRSIAPDGRRSPAAHRRWGMSIRFTEPKEGWQQDAALRPLGAYYRINKDSIVDMQAAIQEVHAIYASATVHEGWWVETSDTPPVIEMAGAKEAGGHAFAMVGYNADGFIIQNSWGPDWGFRGFAVLTYADWVKNGMDAWVAVMGAPVVTLGTAVALNRSPLQQQTAAPGTTVRLAGGRQ